MTVQQNDNISINERLGVQLALALQERDEPGDCLTPDDFNNWVEGKLTRKQERAIWAHIDACPLCYDEWMALPAPVKKHSFADSFSNYLSDFIYSLNDFFQSLLMPKYGIPAFAVVMSCFIIVYLQIFRVIPLEKNIDNAYQLVIENNDQNTFTMPWEDQQHKTLIAPGSISLTQKAFATGLLHGRNQLLDQTSKKLFSENDLQTILNNDELQLLYSTGKWMALLQSLSIKDKKYSDQFWSEQELIFTQLLDNLKLLDSSSVEIQDLLEKMSQIEELWGTKDNLVQMRWQNRLDRICQYIIEFFSPKHIPEN